MTQSTNVSSNFQQRLVRYYGLYAAAVVAFILSMGLLEWAGVASRLLGYLFLFVTLGLYAGIGFLSRTANVDEYYIAGRKVPALFNGMAIAADWMSAASFIGLAGTLFHAGHEGLAYIMGWTGGYVLVALCLAPYLRKFGEYTIPDFLGVRYGGTLPRLLGVLATVLVSLVYVIAQIYGVGLITSRFTGLEFTIGVFVGLTGILVCSFLGGMKAITWTQVAQCIILIIAFVLPVVWLSVQQTGNPVAHVAAYTNVLPKLTALEQEFNDATSEKGRAEAQVRAIFTQRARALEVRLQKLEVGGLEFLLAEKAALDAHVRNLRAADVLDARAIAAAEREARQFPLTVAEAQVLWTQQVAENLARAAPVKAHAEAFPGNSAEDQRIERKNFIALVFCLMLGTAGLPHILTRFYTTPTVNDARQSVFWAMSFIGLLYVTAPVLAILVKFEVYDHLVGTAFSHLPAWVSNWQAVDKSLLFIQDTNQDGRVQLAEIVMGADMVVLATPEIAGLPYVITALVATGGMAAALSTADGLLLTIASALSHDVYFRTLRPNSPPTRRLVVSKIVLLIVAILAAYITSLKPGGILQIVGAAFSLAAAALFPALICGVFWKRANHNGVVLGMTVGLLTTLSYMIATYPPIGIGLPLLWEIKPITAGVFGVPAGFLAIIIGSWLSAPPTNESDEFVDLVRAP